MVSWEKNLEKWERHFLRPWKSEIILTWLWYLIYNLTGIWGSDLEIIADRIWKIWPLYHSAADVAKSNDIFILKHFSEVTYWFFGKNFRFFSSSLVLWNFTKTSPIVGLFIMPSTWTSIIWKTIFFRDSNFYCIISLIISCSFLFFNFPSSGIPVI